MRIAVIAAAALTFSLTAAKAACPVAAGNWSGSFSAAIVSEVDTGKSGVNQTKTTDKLNGKVKLKVDGSCKVSGSFSDVTLQQEFIHRFATKVVPETIRKHICTGPLGYSLKSGEITTSNTGKPVFALMVSLKQAGAVSCTDPSREVLFESPIKAGGTFYVEWEAVSGTGGKTWSGNKPWKSSLYGVRNAGMPPPAKTSAFYQWGLMRQ